MSTNYKSLPVVNSNSRSAIQYSCHVFNVDCWLNQINYRRPDNGEEDGICCNLIGATDIKLRIIL